MAKQQDSQPELFKYINKGSFLPKESSDTAEARAYRERCLQFHVHYSRLCSTYNRTGTINFKDPVLVKLATDFFNPGTAIRPEQMAPLVIGSTFGRGTMFLGMGRGKTFLGGYWANYLMRYSKLASLFPNNKFLVLCPKTVCDEWATQLPKFFQCTVNVFPDTRDLDADIIVTNYEQLENLLPYKHEFGGIILDESQRAKNLKTKTFSLIAEFVDMNIFYRFVLSGTPMTNKPDDLFSQMTVVDPYTFDFSYAYMKSHFFKDIYMGKGKGGFYKEVFLKKHENTIRARVMAASVIQASTSEDVDIVTNFVECGQSQEQVRALADIAKGYVSISRRKELMGGKAEASMIELKAAVIKELQVSSGFLVAGDDVAKFNSPKLAKSLEIMKAYPQNQFIIWTYFQETTMRMHRAIEGSAAIYGKTSNKQRREILEDFKAGRIRTLILQIKSGNAGLNLQMCNKNIFVESDWSATVLEQAICRTARNGQTERVHVWFLYTKGTADVMLFNTTKSKKKLSRAILATYVNKRSAQVGANGR